MLLFFLIQKKPAIVPNSEAFNGLWPRGLRHGAKDVRQTAVGRCLALFGSVGQRALAHGIYALERSREVRPAW